MTHFDAEVLPPLPQRLQQFVEMKLDQFLALKDSFSPHGDVFKADMNSLSKDSFEALLDPSVGRDERFPEKMAMHFHVTNSYEQAWAHAVLTHNEELAQEDVGMHLTTLLSDATSTCNRSEEIFHVPLRITDMRKRLVFTVKAVDTKNEVWCMQKELLRLFNECVSETFLCKFPSNLKAP